MFHIRPWEWDALDLFEAQALMVAVDRYRAEIERSNRG